MELQQRIPRKALRVSPSSSPPPYVDSPTTLSAATTYSSYDASLFEDYAESSRHLFQFLSVDDQGQPLSASPRPPLRNTRSSPNLQPQRSESSTTVQTAGKAVVTAFEEARHFAGGLVSHPFESTKHYSILRHSHGLVFYTGSYTNIAITVFADRELPDDRSFWLQRRGWSGKTGLRAGVLFGTHGAWINVTPSVIATAQQVKPTDERAWQRDISKFLRKAPKKIVAQIPRETAVLRVPCEAEDGYLRIVMCAGENGKKHLCPSPIFRLASTSLDSSSLRGASLKTLPLEAAVKIGTTVGTKMAQAAAAPYVTSAKAFVATEATSLYQPSAVQSAAVQRTWDGSNLSDRVMRMEEQYEMRGAGAVGGPFLHAAATSLIVGGDDGPKSPFPVRFHGKVVPGSGLSTESLGFSTANLASVDSNIGLKYSGIFCGYASITLAKKAPDKLNLEGRWRQAVVHIVPCPTSAANVVQKKQISVHILEDLEGAIFYNAKLAVMLMGCIRPAMPLHLVQQQPLNIRKDEADQDAMIAFNSLSRPAWSADDTLARMKSAASVQSLTDRYVDARQGFQGSLEKVRTHRLGVRMDSDMGRDRHVGLGGFVIPR